MEELVRVTARLCGQVIKMIARAKALHIGSCLSIADLPSVLYFSVMNVDPAAPTAPNPDRFILSKGHAAYAARVEPICFQQMK
jgi:transketolase